LLVGSKKRNEWLQRVTVEKRDQQFALLYMNGEDTVEKRDQQFACNSSLFTPPQISTTFPLACTQRKEKGNRELIVSN
jgi:hypothetical protein